MSLPDMMEWAKEHPSRAALRIAELEHENDALFYRYCETEKDVSLLMKENAAQKAELERAYREWDFLKNLNKGLQQQAEYHAKENAALREWVKEEGKRNDVCTYGILKEVCEDCKCSKRKEAQP